jgi:hypothetical protein
MRSRNVLLWLLLALLALLAVLVIVAKVSDSGWAPDSAPQPSLQAWTGSLGVHLAA